MVLNESALADAGKLVDEQALSGDPAGGKGGAPTTSWTAGWPAWQYPLHAFIDLGAPHKISKLFLYDSTGTGDVTIATGVPFAWKTLFNDRLERYQVWNEHPANVETRYVRVSIGGPGTALPEIVIYGTPGKAAQNTAAPAAVRRTSATSAAPPTMDQFIGINAFIDDPPDRMAVAGFIREYHNWNWDEGDGSNYPGYPDNQNRWNPSAAGGGGWNFDAYYAGLKGRGITVSPCIQGNVLWLRGEGGNNADKPVSPGEDPENPASYAEHADHMFQFAARYGHRKVADRLLKLAPGQPRSTGLGLLRYFENWNEPDNWWSGRGAYFTPYELAAMSSADYDGHMGTMGKTVGVKNADPNARLVMGGIAKLNLDAIKAMKLWADFKRRGSFPFDVINLHHYSNTGGEQQRGKAGISPEADNLREKMRRFVEYRNRHLPGVEVWLTEFGYDTNPGSPQRAPAFANFSAEEVQAQWLVRSYLALAAAGVDRAAMYMLRDVDPASTTQFSSSGLVTEKGAWKPKISWYYVYALKNRLAGMRFMGEPVSGKPNISIYKFKSVKVVNGKTGGAYAVWCPTSNGTEEKITLTLAGKPTSATLVTLSPTDTKGTATPLRITNGKVTLDASERPIFVLTDSIG